MRIVRLANFVTGSSGGLRSALRQLGAGYVAAGHDPVLIVPGRRYREEVTEQGQVLTLPGPTVPGTRGYRVLVNRPRIARLLRELRPDRLEVSLPEVVGDAGLAAPGDGPAYADAVLDIAVRPRADRRAAARRRAEMFP